MPEGDTVWNTARVVDRALTGQRIRRGEFRVPKLATANVSGWTVVGSASRGKHLLLRLAAPTDERYTLHSHLRMDGAWRIYAPGERWRGRIHTVRVVLQTATHVAVGFHLHELALVPTADEQRLVGHLGPDLLGADWDVGEATRRLRLLGDRAIADALLDQRNLAGIEAEISTTKEALAAGYWVPAEAIRRLLNRPDRAIGDALMDQRNVAGIGTVYRAETLFLGGVNPWTRTDQVAALDRLLGLARRLMVANKGRYDQATTGDLRRGHQHWVYGRRGEPCRRCGTPVRQGSQGPASEERVVYWCPACQPDTSTSEAGARKRVP